LPGGSRGLGDVYKRQSLKGRDPKEVRDICGLEEPK
jgi:hypothetical protein